MEKENVATILKTAKASASMVAFLLELYQVEAPEGTTCDSINITL